MAIWKVEFHGNYTKIAAFSQKSQSTWIPQWNDDENYFGRQVAGEIQFFRSNNTANAESANGNPILQPAFRLKAENLAGFSISPGNYPKVAIFIREAKGMPAAVKVFLLPNTTSPVAQKMFFKADRCQMQWSPNGRHLLALSQTDVDSTGVSYYGESNLYFVSGDGSFDCRVPLDREGPIHDIAWSPISDGFIVIYGCKLSEVVCLFL